MEVAGRKSAEGTGEQRGGNARAENMASLARRTYSDVVMGQVPRLPMREDGRHRGAEGSCCCRRSSVAASDGLRDDDVEHAAACGCPPDADSRVGGLQPRSWSMRLADHPDAKRKSRLAAYRAISFQGKLKSSLSKSFKWIKHHLAPPPPHHAPAY